MNPKSKQKSSSNPLIEQATELDYSLIEPTSITKAIDHWIKLTHQQIQTIHELQPKQMNWQNTAEALLNQLNGLYKTFSVASHLNQVNDSPKMRKAFQHALDQLQKITDEIDQDKKIYENYLELAKSKSGLLPAQMRFLKLEIKKYQKNGVHLPKEQRDTLKSINQKLAQLALQFEQNVLDDTNQFKLHIKEAKPLSGLSEALIQNFQKAAKEQKKEGYLIELNQPNAISILQSAKDRLLRGQIHEAWAKRASEGKYSNEGIIDEILSLRHQKAKLLGFDDYCSYVLSERMAKKYETVNQLLQNIGKRAHEKAEKEIATLRTFAKSQLKLEDIKPHDLSYVSQKYKETHFGFSDETLRDYFPVQKVLDCLFDVTQKLYGIRFIETEAKSWHEKVKSYEIHQQNRLIGILYVDLYARKTKRSGAWMSDYQSLLDEKYHRQKQIPVAFINMNFLDSESESYLTFEDILTLFHETGHGLHHLLTQVGLLPIAGINSVQWDAVELPSQIMENFCYNWHYLKAMSAHKKTGKPIDFELYQKVIQAKNQFSGLFLIRQLIFGLFDLNIHHEQNYKKWKTIMKQTQKNWAIIKPAPYDASAHSFGHIFGGGYASGYYSYLWADILSSDAYGYFLEHSKVVMPMALNVQGLKIKPHYFAKTANRKNGNHFWSKILSQGAIKDADELFFDFRNREPKVDFLFEAYGLK